MAALKVPILLALVCLLSPWTNCQEEDVWSLRSEITIDSVDIVTFRCPQSIYWKLRPGKETTEFVEGFAGMREFYSNCIGHNSCKVNRAFARRLLHLSEHTSGAAIGRTLSDYHLLMCNSVEYFHGITGTDRRPLTISDVHRKRGYIYTTETQSMELTPNITISIPHGMDIEIRPYYLYDAIDSHQYDRMTIHIEGPGIGCVVLDHIEPRKWITTNMETIRIRFSSCSRSGRFGIGYTYHYAPGFFVPNTMVVMDGDTPLTGQHACNQRHNRCPQPSPTPAATSTPFPQHSTPTHGKDITTQSTTLHSVDATVSSSGFSVSPVTNAFADVTGQSASPVTTASPDVTGQSVSPVTTASPDVTREALLPSVNTNGTGPQHAERPGVGVVLGGSIGGILLAVLIILVLVFLFRKRKCLLSRKPPDPPQRVESLAPTAPGMETILREMQQSFTASQARPQPGNLPDIVARSSTPVNPGNLYAVVKKDRRHPRSRPPRAVQDDGLTIVENDLYQDRDRLPSVSVLIVENDGYDSVQWGARP